MKFITTLFAVLLLSGSAWAQDADGTKPIVTAAGSTSKRPHINDGYIGYFVIDGVVVVDEDTSAQFWVDSNYADLCLDPNTAATTTGNMTIQVRRIVGAATLNESFSVSFGSLGIDIDGVSDCAVLTKGSYYIYVEGYASGNGLVTITGRDS